MHTYIHTYIHTYRERERDWGRRHLIPVAFTVTYDLIAETVTRLVTQTLSTSPCLCLSSLLLCHLQGNYQRDSNYKRNDAAAKQLGYGTGYPGERRTKVYRLNDTDMIVNARGYVLQ